MRTLVMMVGYPGSGKTYFCQEILKKYGIKSVSSDDIRKEIYGNASIQGDYREVFDKVYTTINDFFEKGEKIVILDATNVTRRVRWEAIRRTSPTEIIYIIMPDDLEKAFENNRKRTRQVPDRIINRMYKSYKHDMPCPDKDFFNGIKGTIYHLDNEFETIRLNIKLKDYYG